MAATRKYPPELRDRATRMALDALDDPATKPGAIRRIADQLGVHPEALRTWVRSAQAGTRVPGSGETAPSGEQQRIAELERENRELKRANTILRQASAFFAAELDRPQR